MTRKANGYNNSNLDAVERAVFTVCLRRSDCKNLDEKNPGTDGKMW